ncbi:MAG: Transcription termination/antitermination protein nusG [Clostridiales bacterium 38_11]|nr:MAG: Transcription termination/antitermination protein nusG [Clostridiales bacterium 38_11]HBH13273.1 transcription antiterminator [Clostridiales bacterium]
MGTNNDSTKWYALYVLTGQEDKVRKILELAFGDQLKVIVPKRELKERKAGTWRIVKKNLFPGYVFLKGIISTETYYSIKSLPVAARLLKDEDGPLKIHDSEISVLRIFFETDDGNVKISKAYKENDVIRIVEGPLSGLEGIIQSFDIRKGRAKVKIDLLGSTKTIQLGVELIDKIQ